VESLIFERAWQAKGYIRIGGIDEAGRGPLAGPVVAACVVMPLDILLPDVKDSKQIPEKKREALYEEIVRTALSIGVGYADPEEIDRINIRQAARLAMARAVRAMPLLPDCLLVDAEKNLSVALPQEGIVHGDALSYSISAASVVAKVTRDRLMRHMAKQYPGYGFEKHKGYGTADHYRALDHLGPCPIHRETFLLTWRQKRA